jgi:hypothetical protein
VRLSRKRRRCWTPSRSTATLDLIVGDVTAEEAERTFGKLVELGVVPGVEELAQERALELLGSLKAEHGIA